MIGVLHLKHYETQCALFPTRVRELPVLFQVRKLDGESGPPPLGEYYLIFILLRFWVSLPCPALFCHVQR